MYKNCFYQRFRAIIGFSWIELLPSRKYFIPAPQQSPNLTAVCLQFQVLYCEESYSTNPVNPANRQPFANPLTLKAQRH